MFIIHNDIDSRSNRVASDCFRYEMKDEFTKERKKIDWKRIESLERMNRKQFNSFEFN